MPTYKLNIVVEGRDRASGPLRGVGSALGNVATIAGGILAAQVFTRITQGLSNMAKQALEAAGTFQTLEIRFQGLIARELKNTGQVEDMTEAYEQAVKPAEELLGWIREMAVTTPFEVEDLSRTVAYAQAFGFATEEAKNMTMAIGNFTAGMGLGNQEMSRIIRNFGQMQQQGKVTTRELMDLARGALVPVNDILERMHERLGESGESFEDFTKRVKGGEVPVEEFFQEFKNMAEGDFPGAMQRMSQTWSGVLSNMSDFLKATIGGTVLKPVFDDVAAAASNALDNLMSDENIKDFELIGQHLDTIVDLAGKFSGLQIPDLSSAASGVEDVMSRIAGFMRSMDLGREEAALRWLGFEDLEIDAILGFLDDLKTSIQPITDGVEQLLDAFEVHGPVAREEFEKFVTFLTTEAWPRVQDVFMQLGNLLARLAEFWRTHGDKIIRIVGFLARFIINGFLGIVSMLTGGLTGFIIWLTGLWEGVSLMLQGRWDEAWRTIVGAFFEAYLTVIDGLNKFLDAAAGIVGENMDEIRTVWANNWQMFKTILSGAWDLITGAIKRGLMSAIVTMKVRLGLMKNAITDRISAFRQAGRDLIQGFKEGIKDRVQSVLRFLEEKLEEAMSIFRTILGLSSPSKVFREYGEQTMEGYRRGLEAGFKGVGKSMQLMDGVRPAMGAGGRGGATHIEINIHGADPRQVVDQLMRRLAAQGVAVR